MMTNDTRVRLTVRVNKTLDDKLFSRSKSLGVSKNAYILLLLNKAVSEEMQHVDPRKKLQHA